MSALSRQLNLPSRLQYRREFFFHRGRARAIPCFGRSPIFAATANFSLVHQLDKLSGDCLDRSDSALFHLLGRTAVSPRRNLRKAGDLFLLASSRIRECMALEKGRDWQ